MVTPVSAGDATRLRANHHRLRLTLNAAPKTVIATAEIANTSFVYPLPELDLDNQVNWSDVQPGMAFWIGTAPGTYNITAGVVRKTGDNTKLMMDVKSIGDPGYARRINGSLATGQYITVLKHRPLWGLISSIREGVFYKLWDVTYAGQNANPNPIARIGQHRRAVADPITGLARLTFTANPVTWGVKTITGHNWNADGGTLVSGSLTSSTFTADYAPGFYVIAYVTTDSGGKTHTAWRYLWVNPASDTGTGASFGSQVDWYIDKDVQADGRELSLTLYGDLTTDLIYPGQPYLLTEEAWFDGEPLDNEASRVSNYIGYISDKRPLRTNRQRVVQINLQSPIAAAKAAPAASQLLSEKTSPTNWTEATSLLTNPVGGFWYTAYWHMPALLSAHDFEFDEGIKLMREQALKMQAADIASQLRTWNETMPGKIACLSDGTLVLSQSPMHMSNVNRNALPTKFTWEAGDVLGEPGVQYTQDFASASGFVKAYATAYDGGQEARPYASIAPGKAQAQSSGKPQATFIVPYSNATAEQDRLDELCGHQWAFENNPIPPFSLVADRNIDVAEPAEPAWHILNIPAAYDPAGVGFENVRAVCQRVNRSWRRVGGGFVKSIEHEWLTETYGLPGTPIPVEREGYQDWVEDGWNLGLDNPYDQNPLPWILTFDGNDDPYSDYTHADIAPVQGVGAGGNPGNALIGTLSSGVQLAIPLSTDQWDFIAIVLDFGEPLTVNRVTAQLKHQWLEGGLYPPFNSGNFSASIQFYDDTADPATLHTGGVGIVGGWTLLQYTSNADIVAANGNWLELESPDNDPPFEGVRYALLHISVFGAIAGGGYVTTQTNRVWLDNVVVELS